MHIVHLAIGGCLKAPPVEYGITADTGGHIAYVIDASLAQARNPNVERVTIVTRLIRDRTLPADYARPIEHLHPKVALLRLDDGAAGYLAKESLEERLDDLACAFARCLDGMATPPDAIHAHFADAAEMAMAARNRLRIPVVYTPHALGLTSGPAAKSPTRIRRERRALVESDATVVSSQDEKSIQAAAYGAAIDLGRIHIMPPGVPRLRRSGGRTPGLISPEAHFAEPALPLILAIARPVRKKNLAAIIRSYRETPELVRSANLMVLAGQDAPGQSTEQRGVVAELRELVRGGGLDGKVALPRRHTTADVAALYGRAAKGGLFVNVAHHEPFGLTLLEAASFGVPVVCTNRGGGSDVVNDIGHGILVDPANETAIAQACLSILSDPRRHRTLARNGRRNVCRYDWDRYASDTVELYRRLRERAGWPIAWPHLGTRRPSAVDVAEADLARLNAVSGVLPLADPA